MRFAAALVLLAACGRVGFDPLDDGGGGGNGDGKVGDGARGDGTGGGGMACPFTGTASCPQTATTLSVFGTHASSGPTAGKGSGLTGSCGGGGAEEQTVQFLVQQTGTFIFTTMGSDYDTVLYARDTCGGAELACNDDENGTTKTSKLTLSLTAGQNIVIVVDGANGLCGNYSLRAGTNP